MESVKNRVSGRVVEEHKAPVDMEDEVGALAPSPDGREIAALDDHHDDRHCIAMPHAARNLPRARSSPWCSCDRGAPHDLTERAIARCVANPRRWACPHLAAALYPARYRPQSRPQMPAQTGRRGAACTSWCAHVLPPDDFGRNARTRRSRSGVSWRRVGEPHGRARRRAWLVESNVVRSSSGSCRSAALPFTLAREAAGGVWRGGGKYAAEARSLSNPGPGQLHISSASHLARARVGSHL